MASAVNVECPYGTVTKVATNVTSADILIKADYKKYWQTFVETGDSAPAVPSDPDAVDNTWFLLMDSLEGVFVFRFTGACDLYIYCSGSSTGSGYVRIDS